MDLLDCHNHTAEWSDGRQSIEQVLERAREEGVRVGLSDHAGLGEYLNSNERLLAYADFLDQYPVARGLEMDLGRSFPLDAETRGRLDYLIGSVHRMNLPCGRVEFFDLILFTKGQKPDYDPAAAVGNFGDFFRAHLDLLEREFAVQHYDILGHPTFLPPLAAGDPEDIFPEWWEDGLLDLLRRHDTALEISNRWITPYPRLLRKGIRAGIRFSVGSDGHEPAKTCVLEFPRRMIAEHGVPEDRLFDISRAVPIP